MFCNCNVNIVAGVLVAYAAGVVTAAVGVADGVVVSANVVVSAEVFVSAEVVVSAGIVVGADADVEPLISASSCALRARRTAARNEFGTITVLSCALTTSS